MCGGKGISGINTGAAIVSGLPSGSLGHTPSTSAAPQNTYSGAFNSVNPINTAIQTPHMNPEGTAIIPPKANIGSRAEQLLTESPSSVNAPYEPPFDAPAPDNVPMTAQENLQSPGTYNAVAPIYNAIGRKAFNPQTGVIDYPKPASGGYDYAEQLNKIAGGLR